MKTGFHWIACLAMALCACQPPAPATSPAPAAAPPSPAPSPIDIADNTELLRLAAQALQAHRLYAPSGDNAVEFYLAARTRSPDDAAVHAALVELQPYLLIATEQALERRDAAESARLLDLLGRVDPQAPARARLQAALASLAQAPSMPAPAQAVAAPVLPRATEVHAPAARAIANPAPELPPAIAPAAASAVPAVATPAPAPTASVAATPRNQEPATPRLLQDAQPRYPLPALRNRLEGEVEVAFVIRPDGSVGDVRLLAANPQGVFDASALAVAARWRFEASGRSHRSQRTVRFRLPPQ